MRAKIIHRGIYGNVKIKLEDGRIFTADPDVAHKICKWMRYGDSGELTYNGEWKFTPDADDVVQYSKALIPYEDIQ